MEGYCQLPVTIDTGGGQFHFRVLQNTTEGLFGVKCYVFNQAAQYLGLTGNTDDTGQVDFNLTDGTYKIRIDYLGYQFFSFEFTVPTQLAYDYQMPHNDVTLSVTGTM